ncbi:MAG TPA: hypothetical protein VKQ36_06495 [Ktedonobacterales bacterium]|nr:hypothetical protein [Ktedonobacterales bacterium]
MTAPVPSPTPAPTLPPSLLAVAQAPAPTPTGGWLLQTLRMTRWTLYLAWRRVMGKVLLGVLLGLFVLVVSVIILIYFTIANASVSGGSSCAPTPTTPVSTAQPSSNGSSTFVCQAPTPAEAQQAQAAQQQAADQFRDTLLLFPGSLEVAATYTSYLGVLLLAILAGALVGGEYGFTVLRLSVSRGVTRAQHFIGQAAAMGIISLIISAGMLLLGALIGVTIGPLLGGSLLAPSPRGIVELLGYWLALALNLFAYATLAQSFATLTKSTAGGIGISLAYVIVETVATGLLTTIGLALTVIGNTSGPFLQHIPDWFMGNALGALRQYAGAYPYSLAVGTAPMTLAQALLVPVGYCAVLLGGAYLVFRRRDITE